MLLNVEKSSVTLFSMDVRQASLKPSLSLSGLPLLFCSTPTILGLTLDRTLFFRLRSSTIPRLLALKSISSLT